MIVEQPQVTQVNVVQRTIIGNENMFNDGLRKREESRRREEKQRRMTKKASVLHANVAKKSSN